MNPNYASNFQVDQINKTNQNRDECQFLEFWDCLILMVRSSIKMGENVL